MRRGFFYDHNKTIANIAKLIPQYCLRVMVSSQNTFPMITPPKTIKVLTKEKTKDPLV